MDGALRNNYPRSAETIVLGYDQQVELGATDPGVLDLRGHGVPAGDAPNRERWHCRISAASNYQIRPGRL
jgi:hypothetical protein